MKLAGKTIGAHIEVIVLPRPEGNLEFLIKAIDDFDEFSKLCPAPKPPERIMAGGEKVINVQDKEYLKQLTRYASDRLAYMLVYGILATPGFEWEGVKLDDHKTWKNYKSEMKAAGLSHMEIMRIEGATMSANCLNESLLEAARKDFLATAQARGKLSSQKGELPSMLSGEPANDLESCPGDSLS